MHPLERAKQSVDPIFWVARDLDGTLCLYDQKPVFHLQTGWFNDHNGRAIELPKEGWNDLYEIKAGECIALLPLESKSFKVERPKVIRYEAFI